MVVGFITTYAISAYHHLRCEFESCSGEEYKVIRDLLTLMCKILNHSDKKKRREAEKKLLFK
jgi:hypothetical protein